MITTATPEQAERQVFPPEFTADLVKENFIGNDRDARGPQAFRITWGPGFVSRPHFHEVDQFQIFTEGAATFGKHPIGPITIHYSDAYTPYGPIVVGDEPVVFYNLRNHGARGAHYMPGSKDEMPHRAGRGLTAICRLVLDGDAGSMRYEALLGPSEDGLGAYEVLCGPGVGIMNVIAGGTGRYQLVLEGSVAMHGAELGPGAVTFVSPGEILSGRRAGGQGVHLLEVQLPSL